MDLLDMSPPSSCSLLSQAVASSTATYHRYYHYCCCCCVQVAEPLHLRVHAGKLQCHALRCPPTCVFLTWETCCATYTTSLAVLTSYCWQAAVPCLDKGLGPSHTTRYRGACVV